MAMSQYFSCDPAGSVRPCPSKWDRSCDPAGIQTQDLQNRNLTLYSAKLRSPRVRQFRALTDDYVIIRALNASALKSKSTDFDLFFLNLYISRGD